MSITELGKALKEKTLAIGTERTIKMLKNGRAKKVFLASNCSSEVKASVMRYARLSNAEVVELELPNDEVGMACKKPFPISVLCY